MILPASNRICTEKDIACGFMCCKGATWALDKLPNTYLLTLGNAYFATEYARIRLGALLNELCKVFNKRMIHCPDKNRKVLGI